MTATTKFFGVVSIEDDGAVFWQVQEGARKRTPGPSGCAGTLVTHGDGFRLDGTTVGDEPNPALPSPVAVGIDFGRRFFNDVAAVEVIVAGETFVWTGK